MPRLNPTPGRGMSARLVLFKRPLVRTETITYDAKMVPTSTFTEDYADTEAVHAGAYDGEVEANGSFRTFRRDDDRVFTIQRIAAHGTGASRRILAVVWTPGPARDAQAPFTALVADLGVDVVKSWAVNLNADGTLRIPALVSDNTAIGTAVKAAWPATWRVRLPGDLEGTLPTGPLMIGEVVA